LASRLDRWSNALADVVESDRRLACNGCGRSVAAFTRFGGRPTICPECGSRSKERFVLALLDEGRLDLRSGGRFLHVAPSERHVAARMR